MSTDPEKSMRYLPFGGLKKQYVPWSEKFKARGKRRGYTKLLLGKVKIPTQDELDLAELGTSDEDQATVKKGELNELAFEDLILSINTDTKAGRVAFNKVKNCKTEEYPEGNCQMAWQRLEDTYYAKTAPTYVSLKKTFTNSRLDPDEDPDE